MSDNNEMHTISCLNVERIQNNCSAVFVLCTPSMLRAIKGINNCHYLFKRCYYYYTSWINGLKTYKKKPYINKKMKILNTLGLFKKKTYRTPVRVEYNFAAPSILYTAGK